MTEPSRRRGSGAGAAILALTQGDPAGIGPEITLKAWLRRDEIGLPFCLLGDPDFMRRTAERLGLRVPVERTTLADAADVFRRALPVAPVGEAVSAEAGKPDPATAAATLASIEEAVRLARAGEAAGLVTQGVDVLGHRVADEQQGHLVGRHGGPVPKRPEAGDASNVPASPPQPSRS